MKLIKSMIVAFSIYSKIPMPRFNWESEDMKYHLCFFPWVGAVIGALEWLWICLVQHLGIGQIAEVAVFGAIPLLVTGGFHVDGFMDTMDAIHSYQDQQKKLEILKDPHIGAFSVISLLLYVLIGVAAFSEVKETKAIAIICAGFFLSRTLSGISVVTMHSAKGKGMLATFSNTAEKKIVLGSLIFQLLLCIGFMTWFGSIRAIGTVGISGLSYLYYWRMSKKNFGGITGDLAGFFVTVTELLIIVVMAVFSLISV